jgi:hypothetical protein
MQFLKWMSRSKEQSLTDQIKNLENRCDFLVEQLAKQNETLQEVAVCLKSLAEVDDSLYKDILSIASIVSSTDLEDDFYFSFRKKDGDEYLN